LIHKVHREICKRRLERAFLSIGVPSEEHGKDSFIGDFERRVKESSGSGASLSIYKKIKVK